MEILERLKIGASKNMLFICGGLIWAFAGTRVVSIGCNQLFDNRKNNITYLLLSILIFYIFYKKIFMKLVNKHVSRISNSVLEKHCIFSFFDFRSYCIMAFMITFSIVLRELDIVNPKYLGSFYIGLGAALLISGIMFLTTGLKRTN